MPAKKPVKKAAENEVSRKRGWQLQSLLCGDCLTRSRLVARVVSLVNGLLMGSI